MLTKTQCEILKFLLRHKEENTTTRSIARKLGKSYTLVYNNISNLEKRNIIQKYNVPPAQIVRLHKSIPLDILINIEFGIKTEFLEKFSWIEVMLNDMLLTAENPFFILIVFGSYANETQTKKSDIDLLIITQNKNQTKNMEITVSKLYTRVKKNIIIVEMNEFIKMISYHNELNVGNEAKKHHIILHGIEQYYQVVKRQ